MSKYLKAHAHTVKVLIMTLVVLGLVGCLMVQYASAEWQYTDNKGKTHTVVLKMDVPSEFANTAREVDTWQPRVQPGPSDLPTPTPNAPSTSAQERLKALQNYQRALQEQLAQQRAQRDAEVQSLRDAVEHPSSATIEAGRLGAGMRDAQSRANRDRRIREKANDLIEKNAAESLAECGGDDDCVNKVRK